MKLQQRAAIIRQARENAAKHKEQMKLSKQREEIRIMEDEFKAGFAEEIPLLDEAGIKWAAHWQDPDYEFKGSYILFETDSKQLKMDFINRDAYRYEYVQHSLDEYRNRGTMVYGDWPKEDFIVWLDDQLFNELSL